MIQKAIRKDIRPWLWVLCLLALAGVRMGIATSQRVYLLPQESGIDDMLMVRAAMNLSAGNWLGAYGGMAIAKNMGFALWLALLHALGVPLLVGNAVLWLFACGFAVWALRPVLPGNLVRLCVFAFFAFQPVSFAFFVQRAYRDSIFPALCLVFFAGVVGLALRISQQKAVGSVLSALAAGLALAAACLTREDGLVLVLFAVCALLAVLGVALFSKTARRRVFKCICALLPVAILLAGMAGFSAVNARYYGVFLVNDLNEGSFPAAYGAMAAVSQAESGPQEQVPVTRAALQKMFAQVPSLAPLEEHLFSGAAFNGFADAESGEFGGSFYFALKLAADYAGLTPTAPAAQTYWQTVQREIEQAVQAGRLQSVSPVSSTVPRWQASLLAPTLAESGRGLMTVLTFRDCDPRPAQSRGEEESIRQVADYLHAEVQQGYVAGTEEPYYNMLQRAAFLLCDILVWLYRVLIWPLLVFGLYGLARGLAALFKKQAGAQQGLAAVLALGLLCSVLLRVAVAAYMEVAAFGIGTSIMYYAGALPPLLLFCVLGAVLAVWPGEAKPANGVSQAKETGL